MLSLIISAPATLSDSPAPVNRIRRPPTDGQPVEKPPGHAFSVGFYRLAMKQTALLDQPRTGLEGWTSSVLTRSAKTSPTSYDVSLIDSDEHIRSLPKIQNTVSGRPRSLWYPAE